ncbi:hypothetical protein CEXT_624911 [Caerostris extrusa]|uniref:Uncharacterized protein n=1 Tax=Caerostris extrusa TaxID=172846 RepID=A0AAV4NAP8_CAEEX|nr:hypothetical protein CEXT_624911 [Caerostris extrusa]
MFLQIPTVQNGENPALLLLQISGSTGYLEPAFFNWLSSALFIHITLNVHELEYACSSPTDFEEGSKASEVLFSRSPPNEIGIMSVYL